VGRKFHHCSGERGVVIGTDISRRADEIEASIGGCGGVVLREAALERNKVLEGYVAAMLWLVTGKLVIKR